MFKVGRKEGRKEKVCIKIRLDFHGKEMRTVGGKEERLCKEE